LGPLEGGKTGKQVFAVGKPGGRNKRDTSNMSWGLPLGREQRPVLRTP